MTDHVTYHFEWRRPYRYFLAVEIPGSGRLHTALAPFERDINPFSSPEPLCLTYWVTALVRDALARNFTARGVKFQLRDAYALRRHYRDLLERVPEGEPAAFPLVEFDRTPT